MKDPQLLLKTLKENGDFLALTLANEEYLPSFTFNLTAPLVNNIRVSVIDTGLIMFEPIHDSSKHTKDIVISSGIHGNETAPIELCAAIIKQIILGQSAVTQRLLFVFGNPAAINEASRFVDQNLNSLFLLKQADVSNSECWRAALLERVVSEFYQQGYQFAENRQRLHYDLHTAIRASIYEKFAVYPYTPDKAINKKQLSFLLACGVNTILFANRATHTFSYFTASLFNAQSFTVELGKVKPFGENDMSNFVLIKEMLEQLISSENLVLKPFQQTQFNLFDIDKSIVKYSDDFTFNFANDAPNFTRFSVGDLIASDGLKTYLCDVTEQAIVFPNADVAIGQRAVLLVKPKVL